jgi:glycosyltransferase involved in cell wall biosynthesis
MSESTETNRGNLSLLQILAQCAYFALANTAQRLQQIFVNFRSSDSVNSTTQLELQRDKRIKSFIETESTPDFLQSNVKPFLISIIIPTYNEAASVKSTIDSLTTSLGNSEESIEIIISDGGSSDDTVNICRDYIADSSQKSMFHLVFGGTNRSESQNVGAKQATGDVLLFLHADSFLPLNWTKRVRISMNDRNNLMGCFLFSMILSEDTKKSGPISYWDLKYFKDLWIASCIFTIEAGTNFRSRYFHLPYGDQALFFRRNIFLDCFGGFPSTPFMEDFDLVREVRKYGKIITIPAFVKSSARRWEKNGFLWNTVLNQVW